MQRLFETPLLKQALQQSQHKIQRGVRLDKCECIQQCLHQNKKVLLCKPLEPDLYALSHGQAQVWKGEFGKPPESVEAHKPLLLPAVLHPHALVAQDVLQSYEEGNLYDELGQSLPIL
jgi:hypothetical protein